MAHRQRSVTTAILAIAAAILSTPSLAQSVRAEQAIKDILLLKADAANGSQLFGRHCASCHGPIALGNAEEVIPALAGQLEAYLVKQLVDIAEGRRPNSEMHRVLARKALVDPQAVRDVAAFVSGLRPAVSNEIGPGKDLVRGERQYNAQCAGCHGNQAQGDAARFMPALHHQHYSYLLSQMRMLASGHRASVDKAVMQRLETLPLTDLMGLADYISRKSRPVSANVPPELDPISNTKY